jgi:hypothetical protein
MNQAADWRTSDDRTLLKAASHQAHLLLVLIRRIQPASQGVAQEYLNILDADASRPAAGAKTLKIQIFLRLYGLPVGHLNAQNCQLTIFAKPRRIYCRSNDRLA